MRISIIGSIYILFYIAQSPAFAGGEVNGYLCVAEKATGFSYINHEWATSNFNVKDAKYILTTKDGKWLWRKTGEPDQEKYPQSCTEHNNGYFDCEFMYRKVSFNNQTLRFQIYSEGSYVVHDELKKKLENGKNNALFLEIGTCTSL